MGYVNLTRLSDLDRGDLLAILDLAQELKTEQKHGRPHRRLEGRILAMYFEKPSLRTRVTFEAGMVQLGGHAICLDSRGVGIGEREAVRDVAKNLERWVDLIMIRTFSQSVVEELAKHARVPVINALTDDFHPCQAIADMMTVREHRGDFDGLTLAYIGDGNNVCASLAQICAMLGVNFSHSGPKGFELPDVVLRNAREMARASGATLRYFEDPVEAAREADMLYTDVWASMGQEEEAAERRKAFEPYQLNMNLLNRAPARALVMHDQPAHRGEEITSEVMDSDNSVVFDQAENRLHAQKAVMVYLHEHNQIAKEERERC